MSSQADKFKIGLFVVAAFFLGVGLIIWLGATRYFERTHKVVAYFEESVQGLATDSPVKFNGVPIGRVNRIRITPNGSLVEVTMSVQETFRINNNLRIKLTLLGLTGQKYLEIEKKKPGAPNIKPKLNFEPKYPVIQTDPSDMREIGNAIDNIMRKVNAIDTERISNSFLKVATRLDKMLDDPKTQNIGAETHDAIREIKLVAAKLNRGIDEVQISRRVKSILDRSANLISSGKVTVQSTNKMIGRTDNNLNKLMRSLHRSADNIEVFSEKLRESPVRTIMFGSEKKDKK